MENNTLTTQPITESESVVVVETTTATSSIHEGISLKPSIEESERFIKFLAVRFGYELPNDLLILIHETSPQVRGYFRSVRCQKIWRDLSSKQQDKPNPINSIVLSSHELKDEPYQVLAHEFAHYINFINGTQDCSRNGKYHNKKFKERAEEFLLIVEKDKRLGFAFTKESDEFKVMLKDEFKPTADAFKVFQDLGDGENKKKPSRMLKFMCDCGFIIRSARTNSDGQPLNAVCQNCNTQFIEVSE